MRTISTILFSVFLYCLSFGQADKFLDSTLTNSFHGKTKLIIIKNRSFVVDTLQPDKITFSTKDSIVSISFSDKTNTKIKAADFWGMITATGEQERFFNGKMYHIWQPKSPYIYKVHAKKSDNYFFSTTLTSEIIPLNPGNIDTYTIDPAAKKSLTNFLAANNPDKKSDDDPRAIDKIQYESTKEKAPDNTTSTETPKLKGVGSMIYILYEVAKGVMSGD